MLGCLSDRPFELPGSFCLRDLGLFCLSLTRELLLFGESLLMTVLGGSVHVRQNPREGTGIVSRKQDQVLSIEEIYLPQRDKGQGIRDKDKR